MRPEYVLVRVTRECPYPIAGSGDMLSEGQTVVLDRKMASILERRNFAVVVG